MDPIEPNKSKSLPWDIVEKAIIKEVKWLQDTIIETPYFEKNKLIALRNRAMLETIFSTSMRISDF